MPDYRPQDLDKKWQHRWASTRAFEVDVDPTDKWTVTTSDGSLSAQFEHTILVTKTGCEVMTRRPRPLRLSENVATVFA